MVPRAALAMSSFARGMVLLAISVRKRRRAALYSAFTPSCNFLADCRGHPSTASSCTSAGPLLEASTQVALAAEIVRVIPARPRPGDPQSRREGGRDGPARGAHGELQVHLLAGPGHPISGPLVRV